MTGYYEMAREAALYIRQKLPWIPEIAMILGSGLGEAFGGVKKDVEIEYADIPNFPSTTVKGHHGKMVAARIAEKPVLFMMGRFHYYEGNDIRKVVLPVWVMKLLQISVLVVTNAAGGMNSGFKPGDIMLIKDHIGLFAPSPLIGVNDERIGRRFPAMDPAYDCELLELARRAAAETGIGVKEGVYAFARGPMYETPAEVRALRALGADAVGMSTVPEVIAAVHSGMRVLGVSCISNMAAGLCGTPPDHDEVMKATGKTNPQIAALLRGFVCLSE